MPEPGRVLTREQIVAALADGPKSCAELGLPALEALATLRQMEADGLLTVDPDRFPDEFVPGNPAIARLPGDERPWPGWKNWRL